MRESVYEEMLTQADTDGADEVLNTSSVMKRAAGLIVLSYLAVGARLYESCIATK